MYRIFSYTFEMSVGDYPKDTPIASETGRNKEAVLYLIERAWCPLAVLGRGRTRRARCGAFDDDLEVARGWARDPDGTDTAPARRVAAWRPDGTDVAGGMTMQPGLSHPGRARSDRARRRVVGQRPRPRRRPTIRSAPIVLLLGAASS